MMHLDLFSGIGGFALAAETVWPGIEHTFVEIDPFCKAILKKHWPNAQIYGDIRTFANTNFRASRPRALTEPTETKILERSTDYTSSRPFLLTGGFPCQPFSAAGRRQGTADDRYLWPAMFTVIQATRPEWIVAENVRGLTTWSDGLVLEQVCTDLESEGYEVQPIIIPAVAVNAPHRRDRVWIIGNSTSTKGGWPTRKISGRQGTFANRIDGNASYAERQRRIGGSSGSDTDRTRMAEDKQARQNAWSATSRCWQDPWLKVATRLCSVDDGLPGRMGDVTISRARHRKEQLKAYGNAIVPQVAIQILQSIKTSCEKV